MLKRDDQSLATPKAFLKLQGLNGYHHINVE